MEDGSFDEAVVVRYLLGDLPEDAQVQVEDRAFSDPEYRRVVEAVEADLIDAYVRDELPASERRRFESRFLVSSERRKKVEFARALAKVASISKAAAGNPAAETAAVSWRFWRGSLAEFLRGRIPALQYATALVLLVLVGVLSWQVAQTARLRSRVGELEAEHHRQQQREAALRQTIDEEHARAEALAAQIQRNLNQHGGSLAVASLVLLPGVSRAETVPPQLAIPNSAQLARIQIQLEPRDEYPQFRAELRTLRGEEILTRGNILAQRSSTGRAVVLEIPASILSAGDYELTLKGVSSKQIEDIGYYRFSVQKK